MATTPASTATLRQRFLGAAFWSAGADLFLALFGMGVMFVLARLLSPEHYGVVAMASVFIGLVNQTNIVGLGHALVRMEKVSPEAEALTFTYALISGLSIYAIVFTGAPYAAAFYHEPRVTSLLRVMALGIVLRSLYIVPYSLLRRELNMRRQSIVRVLGSLGDSVSTLILAWSGFGVWALALGPLVSHIIQAIGLAIAHPWRFGFRLRGPESRELIRFAVGVDASFLLWYWYVSSDSLIIGRVLGGAALGIFTMAMNVSKLSWNKLWLTLNPLLLPLYAEARGAPGELGRIFLRVSHWVALIIFPASFGVMVVAPEAVTTLLSKQWLDAVVPLQWLSLLGPSRALTALMSPVLLAVGKVRLEVLFSFACGIVMPAAFLFGVQHQGVPGVAAAWAIVFPVVAAFVLLRPVLRALDLRVAEYVRAIGTPLAASAAMAAVAFGVGSLFSLPPLVTLVLKILAGGACYVGLIVWFEGNPYPELRRLFADTRVGAARRVDR
jgi:O-antigen/teichoic acid export membrane protein